MTPRERTFIKEKDVVFIVGGEANTRKKIIKKENKISRVESEESLLFILFSPLIPISF